MKTGKLITGEGNPLLPHLKSAITNAQSIDIAVSFIKVSGLRKIINDLEDALELDERTGSARATVRILTSDYLGVTEPEAFRLLALLQERGASVKVFEASKTSFHLKTYIFCYQNDCGRAFVGSSNISRVALEEGIEWNYRVDFEAGSEIDQKEFKEIRESFMALYAKQESRSLTPEWIDDYIERRKVLRSQMPVASMPEAANEEETRPSPNPVQEKALTALAETREEQFKRGLVVVATGVGKTYLAAFDAHQMKARKVLFVAHREEILLQAEKTFIHVNPEANTGLYTGSKKDVNANVVCASVQTLSRSNHLNQFPPDYFDYIIIDEFHHAAAGTYQRIINHFRPKFLLGLTATPDRSDQADIAGLCDDNLVFEYPVFSAVKEGLLVPFKYFGIFDETVEYKEIPWRNRQFDPASLSNHLATKARARHIEREWREKARERTMAFCVSRKHADFMAKYFNQNDIPSVSVHGGSDATRTEALAKLRSGSIKVVFCVDLFNEGVDVPSIDTVMMLRPTDSRVLFLQQLGRGLRLYPGKSHLLILDFIGNHRGFINKPQAILEMSGQSIAAGELGRSSENPEKLLPPGCFVNFDLEVIEFLKSLKPASIEDEYVNLSESMGHRPTLKEFFASGSNLTKMRAEYSSWWGLVKSQGNLSSEELQVYEVASGIFAEVERSQMTRSYKMVTLMTLLSDGGFKEKISVDSLAEAAYELFSRRPDLAQDLPKSMHPLSGVDQPTWLAFWKKNPINAWTGGNRQNPSDVWFYIEDGQFISNFEVPDNVAVFNAMVMELIEYRLAQYAARKKSPVKDTEKAEVIPMSRRTSLPFFPDISIACGHFREGSGEVQTQVNVADDLLRGNRDNLFVARASGNSMNGGKEPVKDGDYLLLERMSSDSAGSISNQKLVIERLNEAGDPEYVLRQVVKTERGYILKATNPDYSDMVANEGMATHARLLSILPATEVISEN